MLRAALTFELRSLLRNPAGMMAFVAYLTMGALAIVLGRSHIDTWQDALETARDAEKESIAEAHGFWDEGLEGPSDRPWVSLDQPRWQDRYAGTRMVREPGPLAATATGSVDSAPVAFHVHRRADPLAVGGHRIENPELERGAVDLVFVLATLTPLLVGILGIGIGGREREERIDRLIMVQAGTLHGWLTSRSLAVTAIASVPPTLITLAAGIEGGAGLRDTAALVGLTVLYTAVWGALAAAVVASASTVRSGAFAFGALWTVLCVLLPAMAAEVGLGSVGTDFAVTETLEKRSMGYRAYEQATEDAVAALYERFPELIELPGARDAELAPSVRRHAFDGLLAAGLSARHDAREKQEQSARRLAEISAWAAPPMALTLAIERLAGVGPEAAADYRARLVEAVHERVRWIVVQAWGKEDLDRDDFDALIASSPPAFRASTGDLAGPAFTLGAWLVLAWLGVFASLQRVERRFVDGSAG